MHLTDDDVIKILKLIEESEFGLMELEYGDLKLKVLKKGNCLGQFASEQQQSPQEAAVAAEDTHQNKKWARISKMTKRPKRKALLL